MSDAAPFSPQVPVDAQRPAVPDVATQPVVPSESAGTQTPAGAPSEQGSAPEGALGPPVGEQSAPILSALEHYGTLTTETLNARLREHPDAEVLCVAPNLQATAEALVNVARSLSFAVEPNDAPDVWYVDTRANVDERRVAQGSPPLDLPLTRPASEAPAGPKPTAEEEADREQGPPAPAERATRVAPNGDVFDGDVEHPATNTFCKVVAGPHQGRYGIFQSTANIGADGWPDQVVVRTRDAEDENIVVAYSDIRPDVAGRR